MIKLMRINTASKIWTPLLSAVDANDGEIVEMLLKHPDIDVNKTGSGGWTPLLLAIAEKNEGIVEILLKHPEIDVNIAGLKGWTPLTRACNRGLWAPMMDLDFDSYRHEPEKWLIFFKILFFREHGIEDLEKEHREEPHLLHAVKC